MNKTIASVRLVGGDNFLLKHDRTSSYTLGHFLPKFNFDDYYCFKATNRQRLVDLAEFMEFKYSAYLFLRKDKYDLEQIYMWFEWFDEYRPFSSYNGWPAFLVKPLPINPDLIIIRQ